MSGQLFKLVEEKEVDKELRWTCSIQFEFVFNKQIINYITITDYIWKDKKGREGITKELILNIFKERLNKAILTPEPKKNPNWKRDHFVPKRIPFDGKKYKLVFWFKDGTTNHLWVKNCHQQD